MRVMPGGGVHIRKKEKGRNDIGCSRVIRHVVEVHLCEQGISCR